MPTQPEMDDPDLSAGLNRPPPYSPSETEGESHNPKPNTLARKMLLKQQEMLERLPYAARVQPREERY